MSNLKPTNRIPLPKALMWIILSTFLISGSSFLGLLYFQHIRENRTTDPKYQIVAVVQTSLDKEGLKTAFLTELLELSIDVPKNLYAFNSKEARERLLRFPVIREASISKIRPGTIWVDYALRKPIAYLGDYSNTVIDANGVPFPLKPFLTPKKLPEIYLGLTDEVSTQEGGADRNFQWGTPLQSKKVNLAFSLLDLVIRQCCNEFTYLSRIDVSKAYALSYGQRQIVIVMEDHFEKEVDGQPLLNVYKRIIRLSTDNYAHQLKLYPPLQEYFKKSEILKNPLQKNKATVIDLRLTDLAFITTEP